MAKKDYNVYEGIPADLIPTRADESALYIAINVKEAIKIRNDFYTAMATVTKKSRA